MDLEILGIRKDKIKQFNNKGIFTIEELSEFIPRKYYDFTKSTCVKEMDNKEYYAIVGVIESVTLKNNIVNIALKDKMNWKIYISFFNQSYIAKTVKKGDKYLACGMVKYSGTANFRTMTNPIIFTKEIEQNLKIYPVYPAIKSMSETFLSKQLNSALALINNDDYLEGVLLHKYDLISKHKAIRQLHQPKKIDDINTANKRILFDDLFKLNFKLKENSILENNNSDVIIKSFNKSKQLMDSLPFSPTESQRTVLRNLCTKMKQQKKINALVQGDVGSGKTLVAILLMVTVSENGYQSCLVAPTNILAKQHYDELKERIEPLGLRVGFLSADLKKKEQTKILKEIKNGEVDILVGTHSLMSDKVEFNNLGLAVIDEEHRFGVEQREMLNKEGVHKVSMSATPIPRSLALSMFGDSVDVENITSLPAGRKELVTKIVSNKNEEEVYEKILDELKNGRQAYIVCPLISKSEADKLNGVANIEDEYKKATNYFSKYGFNVGMVTGDMKEQEATDSIEKFRNNEFNVLIATTIIEVGVNIPNSTVIMIKSAERFGFAQLHQLRGRVGRGNFKSYCYLVTESIDKFKIFTETRDGFKIAEEDLKLRGAGSFLGTQQSGDNKYLMLLLANKDLNKQIKKDIDEIFNNQNRLRRYREIKKLKENF